MNNIRVCCLFILIFWGAILLSGCHSEETKNGIEYNYYWHYAQVESVCGTHPKEYMVLGCFEPDTDPCVIHAAWWDKRNKYPRWRKYNGSSSPGRAAVPAAGRGPEKCPDYGLKANTLAECENCDDDTFTECYKLCEKAKEAEEKQETPKRRRPGR